MRCKVCGQETHDSANQDGAVTFHVLQDAEFTKLGSNAKIHADVRIVAATNRDLEQMMLVGRFREDLYYRLKVIETYVPPLRDRRDEIPPLVDFFISKYSQRYNRPAHRPSDTLRETFLEYEWPGNVRELENMIKRFVILQDEQLVLREVMTPRIPAQAGGGSRATTPEDPADEYPLPPYEAPPPSVSPRRNGDAEQTAGAADLREPRGDGCNLFEIARQAVLAAERTVIADALRKVRWNRRQAAEMLGVSYKTLLKKIKDTGLEPR